MVLPASLLLPGDLLSFSSCLWDISSQSMLLTSSTSLCGRPPPRRRAIPFATTAGILTRLASGILASFASRRLSSLQTAASARAESQSKESPFSARPESDVDATAADWV